MRRFNLQAEEGSGPATALCPFPACQHIPMAKFPGNLGVPGQMVPWQLGSAKFTSVKRTVPGSLA